MDPVQKALWYVESHLQNPIDLEDISSVCKVSAYHLTRAFAATMGRPLMRYVRTRRLSEAARLLAAGAPDILGLALETGYGSHEAFTRAFREQFSLTPEQVRAQGHLNNLNLVEAITMIPTPISDLAPPRFETTQPLLLAGLVERYDCQAAAGIPNQWQRLNSFIGRIPKQVGKVAYGAVFNFDAESNFDYLSGFEISDTADLPQGLVTLQLPAQKYAVFAYGGHIAGIRGVCSAIWKDWVPTSGCEVVNATTLDDGPEFNPVTGMGGFEIWLPIKG